MPHDGLEVKALVGRAALEVAAADLEVDVVDGALGIGRGAAAVLVVMSDEVPLDVVDAQLLARALDAGHQGCERCHGAAGGLKLARHAEDVSAAADAHVEDRLDLPQVFVKRAAERGKLGVSRICGVAQRFGLHGLFTSHRSVVSPEVVRQANADTHPSL